jgi:hypothetical protein
MAFNDYAANLAINEAKIKMMQAEVISELEEEGVLHLAGQAEYDKRLEGANFGGNKIKEKCQHEIKQQIIDQLEDFIEWREYTDADGVTYLEGSIRIKE